MFTNRVQSAGTGFDNLPAFCFVALDERPDSFQNFFLALLEVRLPLRKIVRKDYDFDVYGTDVSASGLNLARKWLAEKKLRAHLKKSSCYRRLPFKDGFFDAVISTNVIHHNYHDKIRFCISEIERVMKPGGIVFVSVVANRARIWSKEFKLAKPRTYIALDGNEKGLPHFIYNKALLRKDFKHFKILKLYMNERVHHCLLGKLKI